MNVLKNIDPDADLRKLQGNYNMLQDFISSVIDN